MHQPVSHLYLHFLFLLLINYIDCRRPMETTAFTPQIVLSTLSCFSPKIEIFLWIAFLLWSIWSSSSLLKWLMRVSWAGGGGVEFVTCVFLHGHLHWEPPSSFYAIYQITSQWSQIWLLLVCLRFQVETLRYFLLILCFIVTGDPYLLHTDGQE